MHSIFVLLLAVAASSAEREPVATNVASARQQTVQPANSVAPKKDVITKALEGLTSISKEAAKVSALVAPPAEKREDQPTLIWAHLSKQYLADYVERSVDRMKPVRDLILGTTINGESHTTGKTRLVLYPNERGAVGDVEFVGEVHANTIGHHGRATLQQQSHSAFRARKRLMMGQSRLIGLPASAEAPTAIQTTGLHVNLPGLRGRIGNRIAWGRVRGSQSQADAIASDHTADDIRRDLDKKIDESLASMHAKLRTQIAKLKSDGRNGSMLVRSRSAEDFIEVALCRRDERVADLPMPKFPVEGNPDIAVRVHQSVLARVASDAQLREKFAPYLTGALVGREFATNESPDNGRRLRVTNCAMAGEWLVLDLNASGGDDSSARVAMEDGR
jgi:hypothetical protein